MDDMELNRKCAEACGWHTRGPAMQWVAFEVNKCAIIAGNDRGGESIYDPLHDDAQCFALVKRFPRECINALEQALNYALAINEPIPDMNRIVSETVARLPAAQQPSSPRGSREPPTENPH